MRKSVSLVLLIFLLFSAFTLWCEDKSSTVVSDPNLLVEALLEVVSGDSIMWSKKEETKFIVGRPVTYQLKSDKLISHIYITLYPNKNSTGCYVIAQAEVGTLDENQNFLQYYQCAKQLKIQKGRRLRFYPFSSNQTSGNSNLIRLTLTML